MTVDTAISHILSMVPGALLAKINIKHAFHLLPVHPADRHLLAMCWKGDLIYRHMFVIWAAISSIPTKPSLSLNAQLDIIILLRHFTDTLRLIQQLHQSRLPIAT